MKSLFRILLTILLLLTCSGCIWVYDRGVYGDHDRRGYDDRDRGGRDWGRHDDRYRGGHDEHR